MSVFEMPEFDRHEEVVFHQDPGTNLRAIVAIHSTALGPAAGGCRMRSYASCNEALTDVLRLSRGMSYKNAMAGLAFGGGKAVQTSSDPAFLYKGFVEYALRSKWTRPQNIADGDYVAEVEISVDRGGKISEPVWKKGSGDQRWDDSVRAAIAATKSLERPPPTNFPSRVVVRFDVQDATEPIIQ